jgi:sulfite exporter TauE/SafE
MTIAAAGFLLGVAASLHCVAMCGPLMSIVLGGRRDRAAVIYHGARVTSYALLGALTGAVGHLAALAGAGRALSVIAGLALIWSAAVRAGWVSSNVGAISNVKSSSSVGEGASVGVSRYVTTIIARASRGVRARWRDSSPSGIAAAGVLNGLLPCGPVYAALVAAAALGDIRLSAGFMLAFGAGTLPALALAGEIAARMSRAGGARWRQAAPAALAIVGVLLTARGLIPSHQHPPPQQQSDQHQAHQHEASSSAPTRSHAASHAAAHR